MVRGRGQSRGGDGRGRGRAGGSRGRGSDGAGSADNFRRPADLAEILLVLPVPAGAGEVGEALRNEEKLSSKTWTQVIGVLGGRHRWDLAVAVLQWLRDTGQEVNAYHYSAAINACEKTKQWHTALRLLETMRSQGDPAPNSFCYSATIGACEKAGECTKAIEILDAMPSDGVTPNHFCYSAAIRACARARRWQQALQYLEEMRDKGAPPNVHSYTAAMSACHRCGHWERALGLLGEARAAGLSPDTIMYSSAISACDAAGRWPQALKLLGEMRRDGPAPNIVTFNASLSACERGGRWAEAIDVLWSMRAEGVAPDIGSYTAALGACEAAGRSAEVAAICKRLGAELSEAQSPTQALHALTVLAKSEELAGTSAPLVSKNTLETAIELVQQQVPEMPPRDLGLFVWTLARLRANCSAALLAKVEKRVVALEQELAWQVVGQLDYGLRSFPSFDPASSVAQCLRRAGARTEAEVRTASLDANRQPSELLLTLGDDLPGPLSGAVLVVDDRDIAAALEARGCNVRWWGRMSVGKLLGSASPAKGDGPCLGGAFLRLSGVQSNSGGTALQMAVAGAAQLLPEGASLWLCGLEEEGVGDAPQALGGLFDEVEELARDRGARVLRCKRSAGQPARSLSVFGSNVTLSLDEVGLEDVRGWAVWPGLFAGGGLDVMTCFLLRRLSKVSVAPGAAVLDFCCGSGTIAKAVLQCQPDAELHLCDADALAIEAARRNVSSSVDQCYLGDGWRAVPPAQTFDWVISNPPVHKRRQDDFSVVEALIAGTAARLRHPGGRLWLVAQAHVPVGPLLEAHGLRAKTDSDGRFTLWRARPAADLGDDAKKRRL